MPVTAATPIEQIELVGSALCLDFANSVGLHPPAPDAERIREYADLIRWSRRIGSLDDEGAAVLLAEAERRPADAEAVRLRSIALRELIYRLFASPKSVGPAPEDLQAFDALLGDAMCHARVVPADRGLAWGWEDEPRALDRLLWPVLRSAADLLVSGRLDRVRECAGHDCNWLFLDTSRNGTRRWCSMETCGNRAKVRRFYTRHGR